MDAKVIAVSIISCFLLCTSLLEVACIERGGMFTAVEELSELQEIHPAEKYSYLFLFPDCGPHTVLYPSFVVFDFLTLPDEQRAVLDELRRWDEELGVELVELYVFEDAETRFCRIAAADGRLIQQLPPPPDYNPYEYAEAYIRYLISTGTPISETTARSLYEFLDPARITLQIRVLDPRQAEILAFNMASRPAPAAEEGTRLLGDPGGRQKFELTTSQRAPTTW